MKKWQKILIKAGVLGVLVLATSWLSTIYLPSWAVNPVIFLVCMGLGFLFMKWRD